MNKFWQTHVSILLNPCHNQGWEYRSSYRSKCEISNVFTVSKSIEYRISNIKFFDARVVGFFSVFFGEKVVFSKVKNKHFRKFRNPRLSPPYLGKICPKKSPKKRLSRKKSLKKVISVAKNIDRSRSNQKKIVTLMGGHNSKKSM